jgi:hypothetical protein
MLTARELPDGIKAEGPVSPDPSPTPIQGQPKPGIPTPCSALLNDQFVPFYMAEPVMSASEAFGTAAGLNSFGWTGGEHLSLYRTGQASQIMANVAQTATRCTWTNSAPPRRWTST